MSMTRPPNLMTLELLLAKGSKVRVKWALQIEGIGMAWHGTALGSEVCPGAPETQSETGYSLLDPLSSN